MPLAIPARFWGSVSWGRCHLVWMPGLFWMLTFILITALTLSSAQERKKMLGLLYSDTFSPCDSDPSPLNRLFASVSPGTAGCGSTHQTSLHHGSPENGGQVRVPKSFLSYFRGRGRGETSFSLPHWGDEKRSCSMKV